ncbi:LysR family transcriptional regulator [Allokutzneria albata]|uniref:ModE molybdate transport repressor domain-containing protein n=1 Tax=Allokutzneria albata TaxID=211114 RepID=A0A1H0BUN2_ALLAB|nr:LysR family transcriptional regulator [Allokutzneria albata]SDN49308.1 ModE molybdate transport repressor domain-containing protein [Allokutzneria albata]
MLELRHLRMLREIARTGSYSAAAANLGYTQPAISQQVKALERVYGTPLLVRLGRRMRFTEAGAELVRSAQVILAGVAAAEQRVDAIAGRRSGRVRLVVFPSGSATLVPPAAAQVRREHPGIRMSLVEAEPPESIELVRSGECDLALTFAFVDEPDAAGLLRVRLFTDPLVALLPSGHRLAEAESVSLTDLAEEQWIAGCAVCRGHLVRICQAAGFDPEITFATDDNLAVQALVAADLGVAVVPELMLTAAWRPDTVSRPVHPAMCREVFLYTWPDLMGVPTVRTTVSALRRVARTVGAR